MFHQRRRGIPVAEASVRSVTIDLFIPNEGGSLSRATFHAARTRRMSYPGPQKSYLQTLAREAGRDVKLEGISKADASRLITGRFRPRYAGRPQLTRSPSRTGTRFH
jgi:hypothetical protein